MGRSGIALETRQRTAADAIPRGLEQYLDEHQEGSDQDRTLHTLVGLASADHDLLAAADVSPASLVALREQIYRLACERLVRLPSHEIAETIDSLAATLSARPDLPSQQVAQTILAIRPDVIVVEPQTDTPRTASSANRSVTFLQPKRVIRGLVATAAAVGLAATIAPRAAAETTDNTTDTQPPATGTQSGTTDSGSQLGIGDFLNSLGDGKDSAATPAGNTEPSDATTPESSSTTSEEPAQEATPATPVTEPSETLDSPSTTETTVPTSTPTASDTANTSSSADNNTGSTEPTEPSQTTSSTSEDPSVQTTPSTTDTPTTPEAAPSTTPTEPSLADGLSGIFGDNNTQAPAATQDTSTSDVAAETTAATQDLVAAYNTNDVDKIKKTRDEIEKNLGEIGLLFAVFGTIDTPPTTDPTTPQQSPGASNGDTDAPKDNTDKSNSDTDKPKDDTNKSHDSGKDAPETNTNQELQMQALDNLAKDSPSHWKNRAYVMKYLLQHTDLNIVQISGLIGNFCKEVGSCNLDPGTHQVHGPAIGIAQWDSRKQDLYDYAKKQGMPWDSIKLQAMFVVHELKGSEGSAYEKLLKADTLKEAADIALNDYERPAARILGPRLDYAQETHDDFKAAYNKLTRSTESAPEPSSRIKEATVKDVKENAAEGVKDDIIKLLNTATEDARTYPVDRYSNLPVDPDMAKDMRKAHYNPNSKEKNDCFKNVTTWFRVTVDPGFNPKNLNTTGMYRAIKKHGASAVGSRTYKIINNPSLSDLEPGDALLGPGHAALYTGPIKGKDGVTYGGIEAAYGSNRVASFRDAHQMFDWMKNNLSGLVAIRLVA